MFDRVIMILGAPRSGTSWVGKIFDSHPDVLYRHEPDLALWDRRLPFLIPESETESYTAIAAEYVRRLLQTPTLKSSGQLPLFPKTYYAAPTRMLHTAMVHALRWAEAVSGTRRMRDFPVPDLVDPQRWPDLRIVMKSISARGRARVLMQALPGVRAIFIMRHPCGQIASTLRGIAQGKFDTGVFVRDVLATPGARAYNLTPGRLNAASHVEQLAWHWATMNEVAASAMSDPAKTRIIRYEDICRDPMPESRSLFAFSGLNWNPQTEAFIQRSTSHTGSERYYSVFRDARASAERWRSELSDEEQRVIFDVVAQTSLAPYWEEICVTQRSVSPTLATSR